MKVSHPVPSLRVSLLVALISVVVASCGQEKEDSFSSTLQVPARPGDGYGLLRTSDSLHIIRHISVAGDSLFFEIPWHGLYSMPKYGGEVIPVDHDTNAEFYGLAASGNQLLWLKAHFDSHDYPDDLLLRRPAAGGASTLLRHGDLNTVTFNNANAVITDSSHAYIITESTIDVTPVAGGDAETVMLPGTPNGPGLVTVAADYPVVYFTTCDVSILRCVLRRADLSGGTSQVVASVSDYAQIVGLDGDAVYLVDGQRLWSVARANGAETELVAAASGIHPTLPAALDGQSVYFMGAAVGAEIPAGRLMSLPKAGGSPTIIGTDARITHNAPSDVVVDDQFVFVLTGQVAADDGNEILAFPKTLPPAP